MQIFVQTSQGKIITLRKVDSCDTIFKIKNKVFEQEGILAKDQVFFSSKFQELQDECILGDFDVGEGSSILLYAKPTQAIKMYVYTKNTGHVAHHLEAKLCDTIQTVLDMVEQTEGVKYKYLTFNSKIYQKDRTLSSCGFSDQCTACTIG